MEQTPPHPDLQPFGALIGAWATSATHPAFPSLEVSGRTTFEWLEGRHFLIGRSTNEHPDFPDGLTVIGAGEEGLTMHYYDSRGVERIYRASLIDGVLKLWRDAPGFSQRYTGTLSDDANTIAGLWHLSRDGSNWDADLEITYRRSP
jgi:hypothetical protein